MKKLWLRDFYLNGKWGTLFALVLYMFLTTINWWSGSDSMYALAVIYGAMLSLVILIRDEMRERHVLMQALPVTKKTLATHRYIFTLVATVVLCAFMAGYLALLQAIKPTGEQITFTPQLAILTLVVISLYTISITPLTMRFAAWGFIGGVALLAALHTAIHFAIRGALGDAPIPACCEAASEYSSWLAYLHRIWSPGAIVAIVVALTGAHLLGVWLTVKGYEHREA